MFDLRIVKDAHAGQVAVFVEESDLLVGKRVARSLGFGRGCREKLCQRVMRRREIERFGDRRHKRILRRGTR